MRKEITEKKFRAAYAYGSEVIRGEMTQKEAQDKLVDEYGFNPGSAYDYISILRKMIYGISYTRTIKVPATEFYFKNIKKDFGVAALQNAISVTRIHIDYYKTLDSGGNLNKIRNLCEKYDECKGKIPLGDGVSEMARAFENAVDKSSKNTSAARKQRLSKCSGEVGKVNVNHSVYIRNADVVAETLDRAKGVCEFCEKDAPFLKRDGKPYLEVHHRVPLNEDGPDTLENTMALCPNCHREAHHGAEWEKFRIR